jgi:lysophospholipase L1-like esterase
MLRWFQQTLPMEGDRDLVPPSPLAVARTSGDGVQRLDAGQGKARMAKRAVEFINLPPKRKSTSKKKPSKSKKKPKKPKHRGQPLTRLINASKSATGSAFFAYCLEQELSTRRKDVEWGKGPDLIVIEVGINDVWPLSEVATRDFEKLLRTLRSMPSSPAVIILEAASLLLAQTTSFTSNAEYLHLPAAQFYDVPILSAKQALFGPTPALLPSSGLKIEDLFLPDLHHPNERGHELLGDLLITYLERQACEVQAEILPRASQRIRSADALAFVDAELDIDRRKEEVVLPLPHRSLFDPFNPGKLDEYTLPKPTCLQIGNDKSTVVPKSNTGSVAIPFLGAEQRAHSFASISVYSWSKYAWARDKQYLVADKPGSKVTFDVVVGEGGSILVDHLRSRFYNLGNVLVCTSSSSLTTRARLNDSSSSTDLDGQRSSGHIIEGYWDLGWSIGVPTEVFTGVKAGPHTVTFELLGPSLSSHPLKKTVFRLIGLITT